MRMKPKQFKMDERTLKRLAAMARLDGISEAAVVRQLINREAERRCGNMRHGSGTFMSVAIDGDGVMPAGTDAEMEIK